MSEENKRGRGRPALPQEEKKKLVTFKITSQHRTALKAYCMATGKSISELVEEWVREDNR